MPWKVVSNHSGCPSSKPFAVVKKASGKKVGCHASRKKANAQIAALNASENKMTDLTSFPMEGAEPKAPTSPEVAGLAATAPTIIRGIESEPGKPVAFVDAAVDVKSVGDSVKGDAQKSVHNPVNWLPFGVTSFAELEQLESARDAAFEIAEKSHLFPQMVENIMADDDITDKSAAVNRISTEFGTFVKTKTNEVGLKEKMTRFATKLAERFGASPTTPNDNGGLVIWKQDDVHRWLAIYSNNYRDRETEIISAKSHQRYVDMVDASVYPMPVLRHFHVPGTEWGQAEMVHYDKETGFAIAAGVVLPGHEHEAEAVMKMQDIAMSHGMLKSSVRYDPADPTVIAEHQTIEISDLPLEDAANQLTNFHIIKEADNMAISQKKKAYLKDAGVSDVDGLEKDLIAGKTLAQSLNLDSKENGTENDGGEVPVAPAPATAPVETPPVEVAPAEAVPEAAPTEVAPPAETPAEPVADDAGDTEPLEAAGFNEVQTKQLVEVLSTLMDTFEKKIDEKLVPVITMQNEIAKKENEFISQTPLAGLQDAIINKKYLGDMSALTAPNTVIDKDSILGKDKPAENEGTPQPVISSGNGLIDSLAASLVDGGWQDEFRPKR